MQIQQGLQQKANYRSPVLKALFISVGKRASFEIILGSTCYSVALRGNPHLMSWGCHRTRLYHSHCGLTHYQKLFLLFGRAVIIPGEEDKSAWSTIQLNLRGVERVPAAEMLRWLEIKKKPP